MRVWIVRLEAERGLERGDPLIDLDRAGGERSNPDMRVRQIGLQLDRAPEMLQRLVLHVANAQELAPSGSTRPRAQDQAVAYVWVKCHRALEKADGAIHGLASRGAHVQHAAE